MRETPPGLSFFLALTLSILLHLAILYGLPRTEKRTPQRSGTSLEIFLVPGRGNAHPSPSLPSSGSRHRSSKPKSRKSLHRLPPPSPPKRTRLRRKPPTSPPTPLKPKPLLPETRPPSGSTASPENRSRSRTSENLARNRSGSESSPRKLASAKSSERVSPREGPSPPTRRTSQTGPASPERSARPGSSLGEQTETSYVSLLLARIASHRYYPRLARIRGYEGRVILVVTIGASGELVDLRILKGSGHRVLDRAALRMVRRATPFPAPPPTLGPFPRKFTIPIRFELNP